jgi:hypothetical protein
MQVARLKNIKYALTEKLDNHPLSSANTAVIGSDNNNGNPPAAADITSQSGGTMGNNSQSANRSGHFIDTSGGGIQCPNSSYKGKQFLGNEGLFTSLSYKAYRLNNRLLILIMSNDYAALIKNARDIPVLIQA